MYTIRLGVCHICRNKTHTEALETMKAKYPDLYGDNSGIQKKYMDEFDSLWYHADDNPVPIFYFLADCGGDDMGLCLEHLKEAVKRLEGYES